LYPHVIRFPFYPFYPYKISTIYAHHFPYRKVLKQLKFDAEGSILSAEILKTLGNAMDLLAIWPDMGIGSKDTAWWFGT